MDASPSYGVVMRHTGSNTIQSQKEEASNESFYHRDRFGKRCFSGRRIEPSWQGDHEQKGSPQHVKPLVRINKTDVADALAICEAAQRPEIHFVAIKASGRKSCPTQTPDICPLANASID